MSVEREEYHKVRKNAWATIGPGAEVAPLANAEPNAAVVAVNGVVAIYAATGEPLAIDVGMAMRTNTRYQFVLVYTVPADAKQQAVMDVEAAVAAGALRSGRRRACPCTGSR